MISVLPPETALEIGEQPSAWAPNTRTGFASTRPVATSSENALAILEI